MQAQENERSTVAEWSACRQVGSLGWEGQASLPVGCSTGVACQRFRGLRVQQAVGKCLCIASHCNAPVMQGMLLLHVVSMGGDEGRLVATAHASLAPLGSCELDAEGA